MPININEVSKEKVCCCRDCPELLPHGDNAFPGYQHGCKLLQSSAFNMIPDEVVEARMVFPECPKLDNTSGEGFRYVTAKDWMKTKKE